MDPHKLTQELIVLCNNLNRDNLPNLNTKGKLHFDHRLTKCPIEMVRLGDTMIEWFKLQLKRLSKLGLLVSIEPEEHGNCFELRVYGFSDGEGLIELDYQPTSLSDARTNTCENPVVS